MSFLHGSLLELVELVLHDVIAGVSPSRAVVSSVSWACPSASVLLKVSEREDMGVHCPLLGRKRE